MGTKLPAVLAATALFSLGGCFSPSFGDGQFTCGPEGECPSGFECHGGQCVRMASDLDAAAVPDATPEGPDAADDLDAAPPTHARWHQYDDGTEDWTSIPATDLFGGIDAPAPGDVRAAWSHCGGGGVETLCFGTTTGWTCTADAGAVFFGNDWSSIDAAIAANPPTHIARFDDGFSGVDADEVLFSSDEKWWLFHYTDAPVAWLGGTWGLSPVSDYLSLGAYDELWSGIANAPEDPDAITASFTGLEGDRHWKLWDSAGIEYRFRRNEAEWKSPEFSKLFERENSPPPGLVVAATRCQDRLYVLTRASN